jgi:hypothetical protein
MSTCPNCGQPSSGRYKVVSTEGLGSEVLCAACAPDFDHVPDTVRDGRGYVRRLEAEWRECLARFEP